MALPPATREDARALAKVWGEWLASYADDDADDQFGRNGVCKQFFLQRVKKFLPAVRRGVRENEALRDFRFELDEELG